MGYNLRIGEGYVRSYFNNKWGEDPYAGWEVKKRKVKSKIKDLGENEWSPSYTGWHNAMERLGLFEMFYNDNDGFLREHPGFQRINKKHLREVNKRLREYKAQNPDKIPGFCNCKSCMPIYFVENDKNHDPSLSGELMIITWIHYWMSWALKNCKTPGIQNG